MGEYDIYGRIVAIRCIYDVGHRGDHLYPLVDNGHREIQYEVRARRLKDLVEIAEQKVTAYRTATQKYIRDHGYCPFCGKIEPIVRFIQHFPGCPFNREVIGLI